MVWLCDEYEEVGREPLMGGVFSWMMDEWERGKGSIHALTIHPNYHRTGWIQTEWGPKPKRYSITRDFTQREMTLTKKVTTGLERAERALGRHPGSRGFRLAGVIARANTDHHHIHALLRTPRWAAKKSRLVWGREIYRGLLHQFPRASIDHTKLRYEEDLTRWCGYLVSTHQGFSVPFFTTKED